MNKLACFLAVIVMAAAAPALADLDTSNAYDDGTTTWFGTVAFDQSASDDLDADVDYVVSYDTGLDMFKYSYQIHAIGAEPVSALSVTMNASNEAQDIGYAKTKRTDIDCSGPPQLTVYELFPGTAVWSFTGLQANQSSSALYYYSVNAPTWTEADIQDGSIQAENQLPSPSNLIPEPMSMTLLSVGGLVGLLRKRR